MAAVVQAVDAIDPHFAADSTGLGEAFLLGCQNGEGRAPLFELQPVTHQLLQALPFDRCERLGERFAPPGFDRGERVRHRRFDDAAQFGLARGAKQRVAPEPVPNGFEGLVDQRATLHRAQPGRRRVEGHSAQAQLGEGAKRTLGLVFEDARPARRRLVLVGRRGAVLDLFQHDC